MSFLYRLKKNPLFPKRPLMCAAVGFGIGLVISKTVLGKSAWVLFAALLICGTLFALIKLKHIAIIVFALALGLARLQLAYPELPKPLDEYMLTGRICDIPERLNNGWRITLNDVALDGIDTDGKAIFTLNDSEGRYAPEYGQHISALSSISLPQGARNEGGIDLRFYYFTKGVSFTAYNLDDGVILSGQSMDIYGRLLSWRKSSTDILVSLIGHENGALAACMLHGDTSDIDPDALADFRGSGISHLLAVSGLHVSLLVGALSALTKRLGHKARLLLITLFLIFYCAFTAFSPSTVRAGVMSLCLLTGHALGRRNDSLTSLSTAFLLLTLVSPFSIFAVGFLLSFTAVLGIILLYPVIKEAFSRVGDGLSSALALSISGQAATLPATAAYFGRLPILAVLTNILVVPLAPLIVLPAGIALLIYPLSKDLAGIVAGVADVTLIMTRAVASFAADGGLFYVSAASLFACVLYFLSILFISDNCLAPLKTRLLLSAFCAMLCIIVWTVPAWSRPAAYVDVLDMRSGYAAYLHSKDGGVLIGDELSIKSDTVSAYLRSSGIRVYTIRQTDREGAGVMLGENELYISRGHLSIGERLYSTGQNGRIRVSIKPDGNLKIQAYAKEEIYAILVK